MSTTVQNPIFKGFSPDPSFMRINVNKTAGTKGGVSHEKNKF